MMAARIPTRNRIKRGNSSRKKPKESQRAAANAAANNVWMRTNLVGLHSGPDDNVYVRANVGISNPIAVTDLKKALHFLASITNDDAFRTAALAMDGYNLKSGGLEAATKSMLRNGWLTPADAVVPMMKNAGIAEAERVVVKYRVPGPSFDSAVKYVQRAYRNAKRNRDHRAQFPDGDTGRKLIVRLTPTYDQHDNPVRQWLGVQFDEDRLGIVPDTREWRRLVNIGGASLHRIVDVVAPPARQKEQAKQALEHIRRTIEMQDKFSK